MDILLAPEILLKYFLESHIFPKSDDQKNTEAVIFNNNNKLVLSKQYLEYIETNLNYSGYGGDYETILQHLISNKSTPVTATSNSSNILELLLAMEQSYSALSKNDKRDIYFNLSFSPENSLNNDKSLIVIKDQPLSAEHTLFLMAAQSPNPVVYRYFTFNNDQQIQDLFNNLIRYFNDLTFVDFYSRYPLKNTNCISEIINKSIRIVYHTCREQSSSEQLSKFKEIKNTSDKCTLKHCAKFNLHERRLIIKNVIIEADDDFDKLEIARNTWKLEFTYCPLTTTEFSKKKSLFSEN